jgi:UDP-glucose 4-epimerase
MAIMVTGGAGYIGSIIVEKLLQNEEKVVVIDNLSQGHRNAVSSETVFIEGDIKNSDLVKETIKNYEVDAVIHMAAETVIERSMAHPQIFFQENVINSIALLDSMLECSIEKIVFSSTAAVYGEPQEIPITEDHPTDPINSYGESKLMFEKVLDWYHRAYGIKFIALRYFNAAGASDSFGEDHDPESHLIPLVMKAALGLKDNIQIFGSDYPTKDGSCIRDFIHVLDLADAHILALKKIDEISRGIYNLGSGTGDSVLDVIKTVEQVSGEKIAIQNKNRRHGDPAILIASHDRARQELGWELKRKDLESIIQSAWKWHMNHPDGYK